MGNVASWRGWEAAFRGGGGAGGGMGWDGMGWDGILGGGGGKAMVWRERREEEEEEEEEEKEQSWILPANIFFILGKGLAGCRG